MLRIIPFVLGLAIVPGLCSSSYAQWGGWGGGYYSSTAAEGASRGLADVVRAQGQNAFMNSQAAQGFAQAQSMEMDNRYQWTQTYFGMRDFNRKERDAARGPHPTEEQLIRFAHAGLPKYLSTEQYDRYSGKVDWPRLLTKPQFNEPRSKVETALAHRAHHDGAITSDDFDLVQANVQEMLASLKEMIRKVDSKSYMDARNFLQSLAYDIR